MCGMKKHRQLLSKAMSIKHSAGRLHFIAVWAAAVLAVGCGHDQAPHPMPEDVLVAVGDTMLLEHDVVAAIPSGLDPADSAAMFGNIVDSWIESELLYAAAREGLGDMATIDRLTREYRNRLIMEEYMARVGRGAMQEPSERKVRSYYNAHASEMTAERPLVKGIWLRVDADSPELASLRGYVQSASPSSLDRIERVGLSGNLEYDYFIDRWVDWQSVAETMRLRVADPDSLLGATSYLESRTGESVCMLHVAEYLPSGSPMPYEFAKVQIAEMLEHDGMHDYQRKLYGKLLRKALSDGTLSTPGYDPLKRKRK